MSVWVCFSMYPDKKLVHTKSCVIEIARSLLWRKSLVGACVICVLFISVLLQSFYTSILYVLFCFFFLVCKYGRRFVTVCLCRLKMIWLSLAFKSLPSMYFMLHAQVLSKSTHFIQLVISMIQFYFEFCDQRHPQCPFSAAF